MRQSFASMFLLLACGAVACSSSTSNVPEDNGQNPMPKAPMTIEWTGPEVQAKVDAAGARPELSVEMTVPTGGFDFAIARIEPKGEDLFVDVDLTRPGDDEIVTQALVTHARKVELPTAHGRALVRIIERKRGVEYLVAPAAQLARVVEF